MTEKLDLNSGQGEEIAFLISFQTGWADNLASCPAVPAGVSMGQSY